MLRAFSGVAACGLSLAVTLPLSSPAHAEALSPPASAFSHAPAHALPTSSLPSAHALPASSLPSARSGQTDSLRSLPSARSGQTEALDRAGRTGSQTRLGQTGSSVTPAEPVPGAPDPDAPRRWSFWQSDGTAWLSGDAAPLPADGSVLGWRFSVSPGGVAGESPSGEMPAFEQICGKDAAASGHKRVAVVVDFGDAEADAFPGERPPGALAKCVIGAENATGAQLLASAARARVSPEGGVLAVNDYPAKERGGAEVSTADSSSPSSSEGGLPWVWILGGAGALVLLGGGAVIATRRRTKVP